MSERYLWPFSGGESAPDRFDLALAVKKANAEYFYPLSVWLDMDGFFVRQSDHVPLTRREIPESIRGERQDCDETNDDRYNSDAKNLAKQLNDENEYWKRRKNP